MKPRALLVANRGEIARRIFRTARAMGLRTAAVYAEPDRTAPYVAEADVAVPLGGATAAETYLNPEKLVDAARRAGADAVHPGYGFLAEGADFAGACRAAGLLWIGPPPAAIRAMGSKLQARYLAARAGLPVLPAAELEGDDPAGWTEAAARLGLPALVKASAGGGGRGMRPVRSEAELIGAVPAARREAAAAFGDATVYLERALAAPRHIEIQILADGHGNVVHLGERECSIQRRHQKIIEEAPAPGLDPELRDRMGEAAVELACAIEYVSAGTVEFLVDAEDDAFWFLEMNTRLQVEHPVTEAVTGLDLVRLQLEIAAGEPLPFAQSDVASAGHAIEARLYAEDPRAGFLPSTGVLHRYRHGATPGIRYDDGVVTGSEVTSHYDPLLSKLIAHAATRDEAAARLARALRELEVHGVATNRDLLVAVLEDEAFLAGGAATTFLDERPHLLAAGPPEDVRRLHLLAAMLAGQARRRSADRLWGFAPGGWRNVPGAPQAIAYREDGELREVTYAISPDGAFTANLDGRAVIGRILAADGDAVHLDVEGRAVRCGVHVVGATTYVNSPGGQSAFVEEPRFADPDAAAVAADPTAPVPGKVAAVLVAPGDRVEAGQTLVVLEAMKMEWRVEAAGPAVVAGVPVELGQAVDAHQVLVVLEPADVASDADAESAAPEASAGSAARAAAADPAAPGAGSEPEEPRKEVP